MMKAILGTAAAVLLAGTAQGAVVLQSNFDDIVVPSGSYITINPPGSADGWTATAGAGIEVQNHAAGTPLSETNLVELDSDNNSAMSVLLTAPGDYLLTFYYSARPGYPASTNGIDVLLGDTLATSTSVFNVTGDGGVGTNWQPESVSFRITAPTLLSFAATGTSDSLGGYLDNIMLSTVPEPSTWAMMLVGFGAMGLGMRRQRRLQFAH